MNVHSQSHHWRGSVSQYSQWVITCRCQSEDTIVLIGTPMGIGGDYEAISIYNPQPAELSLTIMTILAKYSHAISNNQITPQRSSIDHEFGFKYVLRVDKNHFSFKGDLEVIVIQFKFDLLVH